MYSYPLAAAADVVHNGELFRVIAAKVLDQLPAVAHNRQVCGGWVILVTAQGCKQFGYIAGCDLANTGEVIDIDFRCAGAQNLLHRAVTDFAAETTEHRFFSADHALVHTDFLRPTAVLLWLRIRQVKQIHCAVADVGQQMLPLKVCQLLDQCGA